MDETAVRRGGVYEHSDKGTDPSYLAYGCYWTVTVGVITLTMRGSVITITNTGRPVIWHVAIGGTIEVGDKFSVSLVGDPSTASFSYTANFAATAATVANVLAGLASAINALAGYSSGLFTASSDTSSVIVTGGTYSGEPYLITVTAGTTESDGSPADGQTAQATLSQTGLKSSVGAVLTTSSTSLWDGCPPADGWVIESDSSGLTDFAIAKGAA